MALAIPSCCFNSSGSGEQGVGNSGQGLGVGGGVGRGWLSGPRGALSPTILLVERNLR